MTSRRDPPCISAAPTALDRYLGFTGHVAHPSPSIHRTFGVANDDPPSFDFRREPPSPKAMRGIRLCQGYDVTRATTVAPGIERDELGFEEETDYATTK